MILWKKETKYKTDATESLVRQRRQTYFHKQKMEEIAVNLEARFILEKPITKVGQYYFYHTLRHKNFCYQMGKYSEWTLDKEREYHSSRSTQPL